MAFNFSEKKKETFILLAIVVCILVVIGWLYLNTIGLTTQTKKSQPTIKKVKKVAPQPSASVALKKDDTPATDQDSPSGPSIAPQPEKEAVPSDADTVALAPPNQDEEKPVSESPETDPEDKPKDGTIAETTTDKPDSDTLTDKRSEPEEDGKPREDGYPGEPGEDAQAPDKISEEEKFSPEYESSVPPDASELTTSSYRMRQPSHPYSIKLSSNRVKSSAQKGVKVFKNDKTDPYLMKMDLGAERGIWWNVYTGHYKTKQDALDALKTLDISDARIKKVPYANLIGEFSSEEKMAEVYHRLEKQGYEPYVIRDAGKWSLFVGDFLYFEGAAQRNQAQLKAAGFASRIVKR